MVETFQNEHDITIQNIFGSNGPDVIIDTVGNTKIINTSYSILSKSYLCFKFVKFENVWFILFELNLKLFKSIKCYKYNKSI